MEQSLLIEDLEIHYANVDELKPHPKNSHKHSDDQIERLCKIVEYNKFRTPLTLDKKTGTIVCGHGRLMAAKKLGMKKVPVVYQDFESEDHIYSHLVADNAIGKDTWATLDLGMINQEVLNMGPDFDIDVLGLKDFVIEPVEKYDEEKEDDVPEVKHDPITKRGDVWLLGEHRVMCGDSTMIDDVEKLMKGELYDLIITDPPYNVAVNNESEESLKARNRRSDGLKIANDKMSEDDFNDFLFKIYTNYFSKMKEGASIYVFYADSMTIPFMKNFIDSGFHFAQNCIWNKQQFVMTRKDYHSKHEPCLYGWKKGVSHNWYSDRKQSSVWDFDRPFRNELHPTMKPIELIEYPLKNSSKQSNLVGDFFLGSGSTLIACEKTKRKCYGMELDEHYCDVIINRWQEYTGKEAILESTKESYNEIRSRKE